CAVAATSDPASAHEDAFARPYALPGADEDSEIRSAGQHQVHLRADADHPELLAAAHVLAFTVIAVDPVDGLRADLHHVERERLAPVVAAEARDRALVLDDVHAVLVVGHAAEQRAPVHGSHVRVRAAARMPAYHLDARVDG